MACPYFMPGEPAEHLHAARAPLGRMYLGACHAGADPVEPAAIEQCNFGYARGVCPNFPADATADAVRFSYYDGQLIYVLEKDWFPIQHGAVPTDGLLQHQAAHFVSNHQS